MKIYPIVFTIIVMFSAGNFTAQTGKIYGNVTDAQAQSIEFVNLLLCSVKDTQILHAVVSDEKGAFVFEDIEFGQYIMRTSHLVFDPFYSEDFEIHETKPVKNFPNIQLQQVGKDLQEVTVVSKKPFIERQLDKLVINVENSIVATGNTVLDVLQRAPGVIVNQGSSINLKGKSGVIIMIDGKPSPMQGTELIEYLRTISSDNIQSLEIIANPSAKYEAAGNAGIINIKYKKDQRLGLNGSISGTGSIGNLFRYTTNGSFNYRNTLLNIFGSYGFAKLDQEMRFFIHRDFFTTGRMLESAFEQHSRTKIPITTHSPRLGLDYFLSKNTVLGFLISANKTDQARDGFTNTDVRTAEGDLNYITETNLDMDEDRMNGFLNLNVKHSFNKPGCELTADYDIGNIDAQTYQNVNNVSFNKSNEQLSENALFSDQAGVIKFSSIKSDFVYHIDKTSKMEMGAKWSLVKTDNDVKYFNIIDGKPVVDVGQTNHFIYEENINAAYLNYAKQLKKVDFQFGLRLENTNTEGNQITTQDSFSRSYTQLFPSAALNWKRSDKHQFGFTYSKRLDRPGYRQLNPFKIFVDPYTYVVGDPALNSVITDNFEISHTLLGKYITTLGYSKTKDVITDVFAQDDVTKISYQIPANIQNSDQFSVSIYAPFTFKKWLSSNISGSAHYTTYSGPLQGGNLKNESFAYDVNFGNNINFGKNWSAEITAMYQSRMAWGLFVIKQLSQVSLGLQKTFNNKNTIVKLALSDIFFTNHIAVEVDYLNMNFYTNRTWDSRVLNLSVTQRLGRQTISRSRQRTTGVEDEKRRAGN